MKPRKHPPSPKKKKKSVQNNLRGLHQHSGPLLKNINKKLSLFGALFFFHHMDILSAILPPSPPPMALTVNGRPLSDVLTAVANALRAQQDEIRQFKLQHQSDMGEVARRFQELEGRIHRIETDLQIQRRPFPAYGQPAMATVYDAIASIEYRVHRSASTVRANTEKDIFITYNKSVLQRYFKKMQGFALLRMALRKLTETNKHLIFKRTLERWTRVVAVLKAKKANERKVSSLLFTVQKKVAATYLHKFITWHYDLNTRLHEKRVRDVRVANDLAAFNLRGTVRRYFNKWAQYQDHVRYNAGRYRQAQRLEALSHQRLALSAFDRWAEFTNYRLFEVRRQRAIATRQKQSLRALALRYLGKWERFVAIQQSRHSKYVLVTRMYHKANLQLAHRYFNKVLRFVTITQQRRRIEELAAYLTLLAKKYDSLGEQLDLSLDNLSHTNGVLSRVVDTIILTNPDAPQVRSLLSVHREDQTVNNRIGTKYSLEKQIDVPPTTTRGLLTAQRDRPMFRREDDVSGAPSESVAAAATEHHTVSPNEDVHLRELPTVTYATAMPGRHQDETLTTRSRTPAQTLSKNIISRQHYSNNSRSNSEVHSTDLGGLNYSHHLNAGKHVESSTRFQEKHLSTQSTNNGDAVVNRRQRMLSPTSTRENPEKRVLNVRDLILNNSPRKSHPHM